MRAARLSHSSVVAAWRERDRELIRLGADVELVCAAHWVEGGADVHFTPGPDDGFARGARTIGRHPNLFLVDPRPIWRLLGGSSDLLDLQEEPFSLVVAEVLLLRLARRNRKPFLVYSAQNLDKHYPPPFRWIERYVLEHASGAYVCNSAAGERLRRRGFTGVLKTLPLGVDVERFRPGEEPPPSPPLRIGYVGRLARQKGVHVLLDAVAPLEGWSLEFVGGGPELDALRARVVELGLEDRVKFAGPVAQDDLPDRYRSFDVVAIPSLPTPSWTEQFCRVAVEAMASGVPVVVSDAGALPEVVGDAGMLIPPGDATALRGALSTLADQPERWSALRERGIERAQRFRWSAVAASQFELYEAVVQ